VTSNPDLKRRLARLLAGGRNTRDLDILFLWLRQRSFGNKAVADLGNFAGHAGERDQGVTWEQGRRWAQQIRHQLSRITAKGGEERHYDAAALIQAALSAFDMDDPARIKKGFGIGRNKARSLLADGLDRIETCSSERIVVSGFSGELQEKIVKKYCSTIVSTPALTQQELTRQFEAAALKNRLLEPDQLPIPNDLSEFISVYAVERMHLSKLMIDGIEGSLRAGFHIHEGQRLLLEVSVSVPVTDLERPINVSMSIFTTECDARDWCDPALIPEYHSGMAWSEPLEIGPSGKLQMLQ
jgi:hypothetical protein